MKHVKPKTMTELRDVILDNLVELRNHVVAPDRAKEINNAAGKAIKTTLAQLEYSKLRKEKPEIEFLK